MKLKGILDFSLNNFLCLRGFAPMGELSDHSRADESYQRKTIPGQAQRVKQFLEKGDYTFFPEVILGVSLEDCDVAPESVDQLRESLQKGEGFSRKTFGNLGISIFVVKSKGDDPRFPRLHITATIDGFDHKAAEAKIRRIDGNHRLEAAGVANDKVRSYKAPFCLVLFRTNLERDEFSRVFFHNINFKALPLTMEQNLKLILDDEALFPDDKLKEPEPFGWAYYHARKVHQGLGEDYAYIQNLKPFIKDQPRTFLLGQFEFLIRRGVLNDNENAIKRFKGAWSKVNGLLDTFPDLKNSTNCGLLGALIYYELKADTPVVPFVRWILANHLHLIEDSNAADLIAIFDKVLNSRKSTIFVSMPFGKDDTQNHYDAIVEVVAEITREHPNFKPPLKVKRVDFHTEGVSYDIRSKIDDFMANCGLLIANLTHCNANVYHEVGFMDGKACGENKESADVLLFLDESDPSAQSVGFNLRGSSQIRFTVLADFKSKLRANLERHFRLES